MMKPGSGVIIRLAAAAIFFSGMLSGFNGPDSSFAEQANASASVSDMLRLGERMYREGVLPSGEPMKAFVTGDIPVKGTEFTCVSCHLRSGLGSVEGGVITTPTTGRALYQPREPYIKGAEFVPYIHNYAVKLPVRPAYTDATLAALITTGFDPAGRSVAKVMPRYELSDSDMAILIAYLKTLSDQPPPGVSEKEVKFATVIVEGSDPVAVKSMLAPIQFSVGRKNSLAAASAKSPKIARMGYNMTGNLTYIKFSLSQWVLKGDPSTWRAQLDAYYKAEPVFALLGGITPGEWEPVHRFCEDNRIPDLLPIVDDPVISDSDWYTLYPSRGLRQEGEAAARYLHGMHDLFKDRQILQIIGPEKKAQSLAEGFRSVWTQTGHAPVREAVLAKGESLTPEILRKMIGDEKPAALLVWDGAAALPAVEGLVAMKDQPGLVVMSGTYLGQALWTIPEAARDMLYLTYPYRLPQDDARYDGLVKRMFIGKPLDAYDPRIVRQSYLTSEILGKAFLEMRGEYHRDFLLDTIGMMKDMYLPLYERVSFGPAQRYVSKGCYIVKLGKGEKPKLERRSEWVTQ